MLFISRCLATIRERRARIQREADALMTWLGDRAYAEARSRARAARGKGDLAGNKLWSKVAMSIADRLRHQIGQTVADRYEASPPSRSAAEREIISGLVDVAAGIADLAHGRGDATTLHNLQVRVRQIAERAGPSSRVADAATDLERAAAALANRIEESRAALAAGAYPQLAETAGQALQRFRLTIARSA